MERKPFKTYTFNFPRAIAGVHAIRVEQGGITGRWWVESLDQHGRVISPNGTSGRVCYGDKDKANKVAAEMFDYLLSIDGNK